MRPVEVKQPGSWAWSPDLIESLFKLSQNQTTAYREVLGGLTTFVTMAYIVVVNPRILAEAGMPLEGVLFATCVSAALATLVMGLYANYPIALAPGMSLNTYFTYVIVLTLGVPWPVALGAVFLSGVGFLLLTVTGLREKIVNGIPSCLKASIPAGIGMFIAFIGMKNAHLIVSHPVTFVGLGDFSDGRVQTACFGLLLTAALVGRKIRGAILLGILGTTVLAGLRGLADWPSGFLSVPNPWGTLLKLDIAGALQLGLLEIVFVFLFVDLFDSVGTLLGICEQAGLTREGKIPRAGRALTADGVGTVAGSLTGTSTVTSYIESAAGVAAGARTGLSNVVVGLLFLGAIFLSPVVAAIPSFAVAPALVIVGALMVRSVAKVEWGDFSEALPAFVVVLAMPLTFSIATGLSFGLITFSVVKLATGRHREVSLLLWILTVLFGLRYVYLTLS